MIQINWHHLTVEANLCQLACCRSAFMWFAHRHFWQIYWLSEWWCWWWWFEELCSPALTARNSHERASDTPWQTVQFSDHDGMRMLDDSCVSVLEENSRWTVLPRRSCEDHIEASVWLEQQDHHVLPSVGDDDQRYQRPAGTW